MLVKCNNLSLLREQSFNVFSRLLAWPSTQLAHNVLRTYPYGPILVETSQTMLGPKYDVLGF